jgi:hypothetical protein
MTDENFVGVRAVGGILPADLLSKVMSGGEVPGLNPGDYHLASGETVREAANRAWSYLSGVWMAYRMGLDTLPADDTATSLTREKWLLVLFRELGYGRLQNTPAGGIIADDKQFAISHMWAHVPIHLLGWRVALDHRTPGLAGAAAASPQSLLQDCLNRSDQHLWGIVSNGRVLRILRDSTALVGSSYVEFDLEAIFDGELFSDFVLLYLLCNESRLEALTENNPADCWLERWRTLAIEQGTRALNLLRDGVADAIGHLGTGFLSHPGNAELRSSLERGDLRREDIHRALLRLVYRLLFLFVAEDRGALLHPDADQTSADRYRQFFSSSNLRRVAQRRRGSRHGDRWRALDLVFEGLGRDQGRPELGLPALGGIFELGESDVFRGFELTNEALLSAVRSLSTVRDRSRGPRRSIDYRNLGAEELGSVYESLLEMLPHHDPHTNTFTLERGAGNERKTTGSYYTPTSLIDALLDTALDPLLDEAENAEDPVAALLELTVCDPACGSGHFLVAAARRIAKRLAVIETGDPEPAPREQRSALRRVVANCIYGVDVNPLAAELAKVSLWIEALEPGRPLSFLDAQIKVGNSLLGTTPALLANGIPDEAFKPIEGDDKKTAGGLMRRNRTERSGQRDLFAEAGIRIANTALGSAAREVIRTRTQSLIDVHIQAKRYRDLDSSPDLERAREVADAWCAAFVWRKSDGAPEAVTQGTLQLLDSNPESVSEETRAEIEHLAGLYRFFHWHLEFPHIFRVPETGAPDLDPNTGWAGGFSCVIGNPPWDQVQLDPREFFASRAPEIAIAPNQAARTRSIAALRQTNPVLHAEFTQAVRFIDGVKHFVHATGRFPLTSFGRLNTYSLFAESSRLLLERMGSAGQIVPTGIATDSFNQHFFRDLVETSSLRALFDFENRKHLFEAVDSRMKFCLLTMSGRAVREAAAEFAFFLHDPIDLGKPEVRFDLKPDEITLLNPNTGTCPIFRSRRDAEITLDIYRRVPVLIQEDDPSGNPWGIEFTIMFMMNTDSDKFHSREELEGQGWTLKGNRFERGSALMLPLYEAKMLSSYDHRAADIIKSPTATKRPNQPRYLTDADHQDPNRYAMPAAWISQEFLTGLKRTWISGFARITSPTNERTVQAASLPMCPVADSFFLALADSSPHLICSVLNSFPLDFVARQKVAGLNLNFFYVRQLPVMVPGEFSEVASWDGQRTIEDWMVDRVVELTYTAWDMAAFAKDLRDEGSPFVWDPDRRTLIRAELDAAYFHLYGVQREDVDYILDTFPIIKRKDEKRYGEYRTKRLILEVYDAMSEAIATGRPYQTILNPPPGQGPRHPVR